MIKNAIVRRHSHNFARGITTSNLGKPDYDLMRKQHASYVETLRSLKIEVEALEATEENPDGHFVEDTAVVLPEIAVITNPGAPSRRGEIKTIEQVLANFRKIERIKSPGTMDGGDVLQTGMQFFIGISQRTNREGAEQFRKIVKMFGYSCDIIEVNKGLHLKSGINLVCKNTLIVTREFYEHPKLRGFEKIVVEKEEEYAANCLFVNEVIIMPAGFAKTKFKLKKLNRRIIELNMSEAQKMDGGLTCLSLRF